MVQLRHIQKQSLLRYLTAKFCIESHVLLIMEMYARHVKMGMKLTQMETVLRIKPRLKLALKHRIVNKKCLKKLKVYKLLL